jgi:hypothetical protein
MLLLEHLANVLERLAADALDLAQTLVSERIKGRECYRPLAPIVTDKEFDRLGRPVYIRALARPFRFSNSRSITEGGMRMSHVYQPLVKFALKGHALSNLKRCDDTSLDLLAGLSSSLAHPTILRAR